MMRLLAPLRVGHLFVVVMIGLLLARGAATALTVRGSRDAAADARALIHELLARTHAPAVQVAVARSSTSSQAVESRWP